MSHSRARNGEPGAEVSRAPRTPRQTAASEAALTPLLLGERRCNVTFVVDSSEGTGAALGSAKRLLIRTLLAKASLRDSLFNVMAFSGEVSRWSPHLLPCAPDTVYAALSWIHSISCSPGGRDLLAALRAALADPACHAVHLLCADLPDHPEAVLTALPALAAGRPVNVFYLRDPGGQLDRSARDYLQCLTRAARGGCYVIPVGFNGALEEVIPLCVPTNSSVQRHSSSSPLLRCSLGNPLRPVTPCTQSGRTTSHDSSPGRRVLARRKEDGLYYLGTATQQVQGGLWVVQFDRPVRTSPGAVSSHRQLVCSLDMANCTGARGPRPVPGDAVLSPWEPDLRRYGPGRVTMAATECRRGFGADGATSLRVLMWNGCVSLVPGSLVLPISPSHRDRIVRELQITSPACGGRCSWLCARSCPRAAANRRPLSFQPGWPSGWEAAGGLRRAEEDTDVRKSDPEVSSSSSSSSSLSEDETGQKCPPVVKLRRKEQRPPWRYWRRTGPEPQHRQPGSAGPVRFSFPGPQISASPNHSSLFLSLPGSKGRRANMRDVFGTAAFKPRPPAGPQPSPGGDAAAATAVYA